MSQPNWTLSAVCAQIDPEIFFPLPGSNGALAKRICGTCPVRSECLDAALEVREEFGVWGGTNVTDRLRMLQDIHGPDFRWPSENSGSMVGNDAKTCRKGHDLTAEGNILVVAGGDSRCKRCKVIGDAAHRLRRTEWRRAEGREARTAI